jgi:hypothetical protein
MTYTHETPFTYVYDKFVHFAEDFACEVCANKRDGKRNCGRSFCEFQDLKDEAIRHNRIKRPRGWQKQCLPDDSLINAME